MLMPLCFRRTTLLLENGKMKRYLFCCLRGGDCEIDVHGRRKCNFCRYQKCLLTGMSTKPKHEVPQVPKANGSKQEENCSSSSEVEMEIESQDVNEERTNQTTTIATRASQFASTSDTFKITFSTPPLNILSSEIEKVKHIKQLYHIQCELDPIKATEFIPILEATRRGQSYDKRLVVFSEKVFTITF